MELKGFIGGTSQGRSAAIDSQRTVNLYPEVNEPAGKTPASLIGSPGLKLIAAGASGAVRGLFTSGSGRLFGVIGNAFVEVTTKGIKIFGKLNSSGGKVSIAESVNTTASSTQIMIVDGIKGYIYDVISRVFSKIDSDGYLTGTHVVWYNGYFVQNVVGQNKFIYSALYDGKTWDALDYYVAEGNPDNVNAIATINNELWVFGKSSAEIWYVTGDSLNPFARQSNAYINVGAKSPSSVCTLLNSVLWLGSSASGENMVWKAEGLTPTRISSTAIEYLLAQMDDTSDCVAYTYTQEGHTFYVMNFYTGNKTLVYDVSTGMWHERGSFNILNGDNDVHRVSCAVMWNGDVIGGDNNSSNIYKISLDVYDDNGTPIKRMRQSPHYHSDRKRTSWHNLELDFERGVGQNIYHKQSSIPVATHEYLFDGSLVDAKGGSDFVDTFAVYVSNGSGGQALRLSPFAAYSPIDSQAVGSVRTFECMYKPNYLSTIINNVDSESNAPQIRIDGVAKSISISGVSGTQDYEEYPYAGSEWHKLGVVWSGNKIDIYIDGAKLVPDEYAEFNLSDYPEDSRGFNGFKGNYVGNNANVYDLKIYPVDAYNSTSVTVVSQTLNPVVIMQFSDNGGDTWSKEFTAHVGRQGERLRRAKWNRLGQSRDRVFRIVMTDPVKWVITGAVADFEVER